MDAPLPRELDDAEIELRDSLPRPPPLQPLATTGVWIVEWRSDDGPRPGTALRQWLQARYPGWSRLVACRGRNDLVAAIKAATWFARDARASPILHLDARCDADGVEGPSHDGQTERITWRELAPHLAALNIATRCNLMLVCGAGEGVAAQLAMTGQRLPCIAVVAPTAAVAPAPWLIGMRRLYRCWHDGLPGVEDASAALAPASLEATSVPGLAYEGLVARLLHATRPEQRAAGGNAAAVVAWLRGITPDAVAPAEARWPALPRQVQRYWRSLLLTDLHPLNLPRFDFDARTAVWRILQARGLA
ncbi:hypothetical protein [Luteimonas sp. A482]